MAVHQVTLAADGSSAPIRLSPGPWSINVRADSWGSGPVVIETTDGEFPDDWTPLVDPVSGEAVSRSENGPAIIHESSATLVRITCAAIAGTAGLMLYANPVPK